MKVVLPKTMVEIEAQAYRSGCNEKDFMENAGRGIALAVQEYINEHHLARTVWLLCGKGNNGGDAFVAGRYLLDLGYHVKAIWLDEIAKCSPLCQENGNKFIDKNGQVNKQIDSIGSTGIILDGLFGTGFKGKVSAPYDQLIEKANSSGLPILAIDIPSGLNGSTGQVDGCAIRATETIFLGLPKTGFFLEDGWNQTGKLRKVDFGLPAAIVHDAPADFYLSSEEHFVKFIPQIIRNRHKYQAGHTIGLASSPSMPGAGILSSLAAFRGGSGIVRLLYPSGMEAELSSSPYELIKIPYKYDQPERIAQLLQKGAATFIGPGLGRGPEVRLLLQKVIPTLTNPCVIDADALTLFADQPYPFPPQVLLTPHLGEMQTLLKSSTKLNLDMNLLQTCQEFSEKNKATLILKGAPTFIFHPQSPIFVNPTGDPGMATAGSGDVLTGLLAALLAQKMDCHHAALFGVYLHGIAGELASKARGTSRGMMASDIIDRFAMAYAQFQKGII